VLPGAIAPLASPLNTPLPIAEKKCSHVGEEIGIVISALTNL